jgi:hypothetical protein
LKNIDRSFDSALEAVLAAGKQQTELGSRKDSMLKNLVNIGYENQFSPDDRVKSKKDIKKVIAEHLGQPKNEVQE